MARKKAKEREPETLIPTEPDRMYLYKRKWLLLRPTPWKWKLEIKAINEYKILCNSNN